MGEGKEGKGRGVECGLSGRARVKWRRIEVERGWGSARCGGKRSESVRRGRAGGRGGQYSQSAARAREFGEAAMIWSDCVEATV